MTNKIMVFARPNGDFTREVVPVAACGDVWDRVLTGPATKGYCRGDDRDLKDDAFDENVPLLQPGLWVHDDIEVDEDDGYAVLPMAHDGWRRPTPEELARYVAGEAVFVEGAEA